MDTVVKRGTASEVDEALAAGAAKQRLLDTENSRDTGVIAGHQTLHTLARQAFSQASSQFGTTNNTFEASVGGANNGRGSALLELRISVWPSNPPVVNDTAADDEATEG